MPIYRLTQDEIVLGTPRQKGFEIILSEQAASHYAGVLELAVSTSATETTPSETTYQDYLQAHPEVKE